MILERFRISDESEKQEILDVIQASIADDLSSLTQQDFTDLVKDGLQELCGRPEK